MHNISSFSSGYKLDLQCQHRVSSIEHRASNTIFWYRKASKRNCGIVAALVRIACVPQRSPLWPCRRPAAGYVLARVPARPPARSSRPLRPAASPPPTAQVTRPETTRKLQRDVSTASSAGARVKSRGGDLHTDGVQWVHIIYLICKILRALYKNYL